MGPPHSRVPIERAFGSVHRVGVQLVPRFARLSASIVKGSPAHVSTLSGRSINRHPAGSPQPPPGGAEMLAAGPVAFRPPGIRFLGILSRRGLVPPLRS